MPSPDTILDGLTATANDWRLLAFGWHAALTALLASLALGARPTNRLTGALLTMPLMSVSALAWVSGNLFNAAAFALLSIILATTAYRLSPDPVRAGPSPAVGSGVLLVIYGWVYPHFLRTDSWIEYAYAAPVGLLPCPTLAVVTGFTLILGLLGSSRWSAVLAAAGLLYGAVGVFALGVTLDYGLLAGATIVAWLNVSAFRIGRPMRVPANGESDELLDRFLPVYDVVERHQIRVTAPAPVTLMAAKEQDLLGLPIVRAIFKTRALVLGAAPDDRPRPGALLAWTLSLGWGVLAEIPGREVVVGAVTKPWESDVTFRALPPDQFAAFDEPGFVKIAWTLRADPIGVGESRFRTETRAIATDAEARAKFRRYWAIFSPGIAVIRWLSLRPLKEDAERRTAARVPFVAARS